MRIAFSLHFSDMLCFLLVQALQVPLDARNDPSLLQAHIHYPNEHCGRLEAIRAEQSVRELGPGELGCTGGQGRG